MAAAVVQVRFHGALEDFLPPNRRGRVLQVPFEPSVTPGLKDLLEALGPPHPEMARVTLSNSGGTREVQLNHRLGPDEADARIDVHPFEPSSGSPWPLPPRFLLDVHLGALARHLRLLGLDAQWRPHADDAELARRSGEDEGRILLSRDVGLLKRSAVRHGYFPRSDDPRRQLEEVAHRFDLRTHARPFTRCLRCNGALREASAEDVSHLVPPRVREARRAFRRCEGCGRLYWAGTHHARLEALVREVLAPEGP